MGRKILVSAGDPSGDLHAARLIEMLRDFVPDLEFFGLGGPRLKAAGMETISAEDLGIVGFEEALPKLRVIRECFRELVRRARKEAHLAILVDYPGFNLRLARSLHTSGIKTIYYILPQVWAWGTWRVKLLRRYVSKALVILPFEEPFLRAYGIDAEYVGHPTLDLLEEETNLLPREGEWVVGLLPGSRVDEVRRLLPRMLAVKRLMEKNTAGIHFLLSLVPDMGHIKETENLRVYRGEAGAIIRSSDLLLVASGTASLEAGLLGKPMIVLYMLKELSWLLARFLAKVDHVSLVNLLLGERVVPEYVQRIPTDEVAHQALTLLLDSEKRHTLQKKLSTLRESLGESGATLRAARRVAEYLGETPEKTKHFLQVSLS